MIKISFDLPPNIDAIRKRFDIKNRNVVFTYGEVLYNPSGGEITHHLFLHETQHSYQQDDYPGGPAAWWDRYFVDTAFRVGQEVEAYREQLKYIKGKCANRKEYRQALQMLARDLSSPIYGKSVTLEEAKKLIDVR